MGKRSLPVVLVENRVCAKFVAEVGFSVCHCSMSSGGLGGTPENTLLAVQWHTGDPLAVIRAHTG